VGTKNGISICEFRVNTLESVTSSTRTRESLLEFRTEKMEKKIGKRGEAVRKKDGRKNWNSVIAWGWCGEEHDAAAVEELRKKV